MTRHTLSKASVKAVGASLSLGLLRIAALSTYGSRQRLRMHQLLQGGMPNNKEGPRQRFNLERRFIVAA